jgi:alkylated DNA nucleotide flippase Atl1
MTYRKKSWQEKMADKKSLPKVLKLEQSFPCYKVLVKMGANEDDKIVLTNPSEVEEIMKSVPEGKLITIYEICKKLSKKYNVKGCCTLTTGIFIMTAANAAYELRQEGKKCSNPYWRTLKADGFLNDKYPGGVEAQKEMLENEGFKVAKRGKRYFVPDFEKRLVKIK